MPRRDVLLAHADERDLTQLDEYRAVGGYDALEKARGMDSDALIDELVASTLRGRGGAGFPTGRKASLVDRSGARPSYLVVNADESEPGAFKDREIMGRNPHLLIEGCLIARARDPLHAASSSTSAASTSRSTRCCSARSTTRARRGSSATSTIIVHRGAGAYICGEETALLDSLEGKRGQPRPRPPFPPIQGLYMSPTQINNVQTIATIPAIIAMGADGVREDRARELAGHRDLLALRQRRESRQLRARARIDAARADLRRRRRRARTATRSRRSSRAARRCRS